MKIKSAEYILSAVKPEQYPKDNWPQVVFMGRSNVGKSSLINGLLQRKNIARTSGQPGKTQTINFFSVNDEWFLVDLPGYGYAKVSKTQRAEWSKMIEKYLFKEPEKKLYCQLVDIRHAPSKEDKEMTNWLQYYDLNYIVIATKADKVKRGARAKKLATIKRDLNINQDELFLFSAVNKEGRNEILKQIDLFLKIVRV